MHIFITAPAKVYALYKCTTLIVGDQYTDIELMNFLGAKLIAGIGDAPAMYTLCAAPRAVMDVLQEKGFELKLAQTLENHTTWIMVKSDIDRGRRPRTAYVSPAASHHELPAEEPVQSMPRSPRKVPVKTKPHSKEGVESVTVKRAGSTASSAPSLYDDEDEPPMQSMPRGPRKVPVKTKPHSREGVEDAVIVKGVGSPHRKQLYDEHGNPVQMRSADSNQDPHNENDIYAANPRARKTDKNIPRNHPGYASNASDSENDEHKPHEPVEHRDDPVLTAKKRRSGSKEKK